MSDRLPTLAKPVSGLHIAIAALLDVVFVVLFAALGRAEHGGAATFAGLWSTAWPFLASLAVAWIAGLVWRRPFRPVLAGVPLVIGTVVIGMVLRVLLTEGGAALPFVIVATCSLSLALIGWRLIATLLLRPRRMG